MRDINDHYTTVSAAATRYDPWRNRATKRLPYLVAVCPAWVPGNSKPA